MSFVYMVFGRSIAHVSRGTIHLIPKGREFSLPLDPGAINRYCVYINIHAIGTKPQVFMRLEFTTFFNRSDIKISCSATVFPRISDKRIVESYKIGSDDSRVGVTIYTHE